MRNQLQKSHNKNNRQARNEKQEDEKTVHKEPVKKISTKAELKETLNEINKIVDELTNGH